MSGARLRPDAYTAWRASTLGRATEELETRVVLDLVGALRNARVLDAGAGDGTYAIETAARGASVIAVDADASMLEAACARAAKRGVRIAIARASIESLPFDDGSFDVALAVTVLCLVKRPSLALTELARVLRPGGRLVLGELSRWSAWAARRRIRGWLGDTTWRRARFWTLSELAALARSGGLRSVGEARCVFYPPTALAARVLAPLDPWLAGMHVPGAAFIAMAALKPGAPP